MNKIKRGKTIVKTELNECGYLYTTVNIILTKLVYEACQDQYIFFVFRINAVSSETKKKHIISEKEHYFYNFSKLYINFNNFYSRQLLLVKGIPAPIRADLHQLLKKTKYLMPNLISILLLIIQIILRCYILCHIMFYYVILGHVIHSFVHSFISLRGFL